MTEPQVRPTHEEVESYIRSLNWQADAPDVWKTLVAGNIRGFAAFVRREQPAGLHADEDAELLSGPVDEEWLSAWMQRGQWGPQWRGLFRTFVCDVAEALRASAPSASPDPLRFKFALRVMLRQIPQGSGYLANRYDTDDEHVLKVWNGQGSYDIRLPKSRVGEDAPTPFSSLEKLLLALDVKLAKDGSDDPLREGIANALRSENVRVLNELEQPAAPSASLLLEKLEQLQIEWTKRAIEEHKEEGLALAADTYDICVAELHSAVRAVLQGASAAKNEIE